MKKLYLIVNPEGGAKKGLDILERVEPIFSEADIELTILKTKYAGHAEEYANKLPYAGYDGLCAIGGDGTMHEVINGMLKRDDNAMLPIGLLTGGTGNAFMHDINCLDPLESARRIVNGELRPMDIAKVKANRELFYAFNIIGWGLVTDASSLAEKLRWLGDKRYALAAILEVIISKKRISKLILDGQEIDEDFNIVNIVQKYAIKVGSKFYCSDKKANCTVAGFEPFEYSSDDDLNIIVDYDGGEKGTSFIDELNPI